MVNASWALVPKDIGSESAMKFGGRPLLPAGVHWPHCATCSQPMHFLAQIPLTELEDSALAREV